MPAPQSSAAARRYGLAIALFYAGYFCVPGTMVPFFPLWLEGRGLSPSEIAAVLSVPLFLRLVVTPFGSWLAELAPSRRFAARVCTFAGLALFLAVWAGSGFWPILLLATASNLFFSQALPVVEALALSGVRRLGLDYGWMRLPGSAAYILCNLAGGAMLGLFPVETLFAPMAAAMALAALASLALPRMPPALRAAELAEAAAAPRASARVVLTRPALVSVIAASALVQASQAALFSFGSIHWQALGFGGVAIGVLWATGVVAEIAVFAVAGRLGRRLSPAGFLALAAAGSLLRWSLFVLEPGFAGYFLLQLLHAFTFGCGFVGLQHGITRMVPEEVTGPAQGVAMVAAGATLAAAMAVAGPLYEAYGVYVFAWMNLPAALALAVLALPRLLPPQPQSAAGAGSMVPPA